MSIDKELIEAQKLWENEEKSDINHEVYINGEVYTFHDVKLYNDKMQIRLPEQFAEMPDKMKQIKYPMSDRPSIIQTNVLGSVDFNFTMTGASCTPEEIPEIMQYMKKMIQRMMPHYKMEQDYQGKTVNGIYAGFDYTYNTLDSRVYDLAYGVCIDGKMMMGNFLCSEQDRHWWERIKLEVIGSIVDLTREKEGNYENK